MSDPRYPDAVTDTGPEFPTVEAERDYWKGLALSYAAKLGALELVFKRSWTAKVDPNSGYVYVEEDQQGEAGNA